MTLTTILSGIGLAVLVLQAAAQIPPALADLIGSCGQVLVAVDKLCAMHGGQRDATNRRHTTVGISHDMDKDAGLTTVRPPDCSATRHRRVANRRRPEIAVSEAHEATQQSAI
jgi:hypothetical protein